MSKTICSIAKEIGSGITPLRSEKSFWDSNDIPWLKTEQLGEYKIFDTNEYISRAALQNTSIKLWPIHTVSIAMYGEGKTRGNASILMAEMTTNQACCNIIVDEHKADYRFLYYWIKHNYIPLRTLAAGVRKNLNSDDIKRFPFPDLSLKQQQAIANVLSSLDERITLNRSICSELEAMAKTLYDYWFVQFDFPDENGKPYRTNGGAMEWCQVLGREVPKEWKAGKLSNFVSIQKEGFDPSGYGDVTVEHYSIPAYDDEHYPSFDPANTILSGKYAVPLGSILFSKLNPQFKRIWNPPCLSDVRACSTEFMVYLPVKEALRPFIYATLNSDAFYRFTVQIASSSTGSRKRLDPDATLEYAILKPDSGITQQFCDQVKPIMEQVKKLQIENHELTKLRDWLLPMLMNGQSIVKQKGEAK